MQDLTELIGFEARGEIGDATSTATTEPNGPDLPEPEESGGSGDEDLVDFVSTSTIEAVLERAGDDPEVAAQLKAAEELRGEKARKTLIEALERISSTPPVN